jgi:cullin 4
MLNKRLASTSSDVSLKKARTTSASSSSSSSNMLPKKSLSGEQKLQSAQSGAAVRKLVVKNLKATPALPADFEASTWTRLSLAIDAIHASRAVDDSLEQLYGAVEALCAHGHSARLYERLRASLAAHVGGPLAAALAHVSAGDDALLVALDRVWQAHCDQTLLVRSVFLYLDRTYVLQQQQPAGADMAVDAGAAPVSSKRQSLWDVALGDFRELVLLRHGGAVLSAAQSALLDLVVRDRKGVDVDRALARRLLRMLATLNLYKDDFEPLLLRATESFYGSDASERAQELPLAAYLRYAEQTLGDESRRVDQYIDERSRRALIATVERCVLRWPARLDALVAGGVGRLVDDAATSDLARLYRLLTRRGVALHAELKDAWCAYVGDATEALVTDASREPTLVVDLIALRERLENVMRDAFQADLAVQNATRDALERAVNVRATRVAQLAARHSDVLLRSGVKQTAAEIDAQLGQLVTLFRLLHAKDVFEAFYGKFLAKRLLLQRSGSDDAEKSMLTRLKSESGAQYTSKLEGMVRDQATSDDVARAFAADDAASGALKQLGAGCELKVAVLTHGFWPQYSPIECSLPPSMDAMLDVFKQFYGRKFQGRRLHWQHSLSHGVVRAMLPRGRKELYASLFQALVLMAFNDVRGAAPLSVAAIMRHTSLPLAEARRTLESVSTKIRILVRKGDDSLAASSQQTMALDASEDSVDVGAAAAHAADAIQPDTEFHVNDRFRSKMVRIKINSVQARETTADNDKTQKSVVQSRQYQIDAAIVRVMKARKVLPLSDLLGELFAQLKFPVEAADLKKRIESLRDREYLEQDENDATVLRYLA